MNVAFAALALAILAPTLCGAQAFGDYGRHDPCRRPGASHPLRCLPYPRRIAWHDHACRWVEEAPPAGHHDFEMCPGKDGVWRPSGRG